MSPSAPKKKTAATQAARRATPSTSRSTRRGAATRPGPVSAEAREGAAQLASALMEWTIAVACVELLKESSARKKLAEEARGRSLRRHRALGSPIRLDMKSVERRAAVGWHARENALLFERCEAGARAVERSGAHEGLKQAFVAALSTQGEAAWACLDPKPETVAAVQAAKAQWLDRYADDLAAGLDWDGVAANTAQARRSRQAAKKADGLTALDRLEGAIDHLKPKALAALIAEGALEAAKAASKAGHDELFARALRGPLQYWLMQEFSFPPNLLMQQRYEAVLNLLAPTFLDAAPTPADLAAGTVALDAERGVIGVDHPLWRDVISVGRPALLWAMGREELTRGGQLDRQIPNLLFRFFGTTSPRPQKRSEWSLLDLLGSFAPERQAREWLRSAPPDALPKTRERLLHAEADALAATVDEARRAAPEPAKQSDPSAVTAEAQSIARPPRRPGGAL